MKYIYSAFQIVVIFQLNTVHALALKNEPATDTLKYCDGYFEEVSLSTDRTLYIAGEEIWFSTLLQCNQHSKYDCMSRVMYIEVYKELNSFSIRQKLKINNGKANGSVSIPSDFPTGHYYIRAYTNYQKNYLIADLTYSEILILNPEIPLSAPVDEDPAELIFKGGSAIYGLPAKAVIMVKDKPNSMAHAEVVTATNEIVSSVSMVGTGLGLFEFTPRNDEEYFVKINLAGNDSLMYPIRNISNSGWNLYTKWDNELVNITLMGADTEPMQNGTLVIKDPFMRTVFRESIQMNGNTWQRAIPAKLLDTKMNYIGIKNEKGDILLYTAVGNPIIKSIPLQIETNKPVYSYREAVELTISGPEGEDRAYTNLTISVILKGSAQNSEMKNASSDFFEANAIIHEHSIRQNSASLQKIFRENAQWLIQRLPEIRDVSFTGVVLDADSKEPVSQCKVYLSVLGSEPQLHVYETREDGAFIFSLNNLTGNRKLFVGIDYMQHSNAEIFINSDFVQEYVPAVNTLAFTADHHAVYEELYVNMQLAKKFGYGNKTYLPTDFQPQPVFIHPDISVVLSDYIELSTMQEVFNEIIPFTYLREKKNSFYFQMKDPDTEIILDDPLILFDNVPVFEISSILDLSPVTIERVDIIHQKYSLGAFRFNGIINIISKEFQLEHIEFPGGTVFFDYQAVNPAVEFKLPDSQAIKDTRKSIPYFNNLLYWKANLVLSDSPVKLEFFTGNNEAEYQIIVRGVTSDGIPCYGERIIQVERDTSF